jgi:hypothetical protein
VRLTDSEHEQLSRRAAALGKTRAALVREALRRAAEAETQASATPTRTDALGLLANAAEEGSVTAMVALERALRLQPVEPDRRPVVPGTVRVRDLPPGALRVVR